ncbi:hypothetical protein D9M71_537580 [compost metagenome]
MRKHLEHRATGLDHHVRRKPLAKQVIPGDGAIGQVDVGSMVDNSPVDLFRHTHVKAAIARFHVESRNLAALGRNDGHAAVSVPQHQQCLGLDLSQHAIDGNDHIANGFRAGGTSCVEEVVGFANTQILEEDLIELIIVVLAGVHQHMLTMLVQCSHDAR